MTVTDLFTSFFPSSLVSDMPGIIFCFACGILGYILTRGSKDSISGRLSKQSKLKKIKALSEEESDKETPSQQPRICEVEPPPVLPPAPSPEAPLELPSAPSPDALEAPPAADADHAQVMTGTEAAAEELNVKTVELAPEEDAEPKQDVEPIADAQQEPETKPAVVSERVAKLLAKKAERKARKAAAQQQEEAAAQLHEASPNLATHTGDGDGSVRVEECLGGPLVAPAPKVSNEQVEVGERLDEDEGDDEEWDDDELTAWMQMRDQEVASTQHWSAVVQHPQPLPETPGACWSDACDMWSWPQIPLPVQHMQPMVQPLVQTPVQTSIANAPDSWMESFDDCTGPSAMPTPVAQCDDSVCNSFFQTPSVMQYADHDGQIYDLVPVMIPVGPDGQPLDGGTVVDTCGQAMSPMSPMSFMSPMGSQCM